jgi:hypothetical protein
MYEESAERGRLWGLLVEEEDRRGLAVQLGMKEGES